MATLAFRVSADYEELLKLQKEIENTKKAIASLDVSQTKEKFNQLNDKLGELSQQYGKLASEAAKSGAQIEVSAMSLTKALSAIGGVAALKELGSKIVETRGQFQQMDTAIQTLLGNKQKADDLLAQVKQFAQVSPLEVSQVISATQMMLGFNIEAEKVPRYLQAIGDVSMGDATKFNSLTLAFSQMSAAGKLMGQDLNQMINAGFNPLQIISEKTGKSISQLKDEMSKGTITSQMVQDAFISATSAGGKFFNMSQNAAKTIPGQISMLNDAIDNMFNTIGQSSEGVILSSISGLTSLVQNYEQVGKVLASLVGSYGLYRTAVIIATAAENGKTIATVAHTVATKAAAIAQDLLNKTMLANPYVAAAAALGAVVTALVATSSSISDAEAAQKTLNDTTKEAEEAQARYNEETQSAISLASNDSVATDDRRNAMNLLIKRYPTIIQKYIDEEGHLKNILQLKREIAAIDGNGTVRSHINKANQYTNIGKTLKAIGDKHISGGNITDEEKKIEEDAIEQYAKAKGMSKWRVKLATPMKDIISYFDSLSEGERKQAGRTNASNRVNQFSDTFGGMSDKRLSTLVATLQKAKKQGHKNTAFQYKELQGASYSQSDIDTMLTKATGIQQSRKQAQTYQHDAKQARAEWDKAEKEVKRLEASKTATTAQVKKARENRDAKSKAYKQITGQTPEAENKTAATNAKKTAAANRKATQDAKKVETALIKAQQAKENMEGVKSKISIENDRTAKDMAFETEQATIDALEDSSEKTLRQLDLNKRKELDKIDRDYEDLRQKRIEDAKKLWDADTNNKDNNFYDSESYKTAASDGQYTDAEKANRAAKIAKANADYIKGTKEVEKTSLDAMTAYLKEYGSMQEKRLAIAKEYDEKIALAQTDGEHLTLQAQKAKALADFDINSQKQSMNWENVFGNLDMFTKAQLENIKSQLRDMLSSNDMDLEGYKTAVDQIDRVNDAILVAEDKQKSFLGVSITYGETRRKLEMDVADAMQRQADLQGQLGSAQAGMNLNRFALWQTLQNAGISYNQRGITTANRGDILQKVGDKYGVDSSKYKEVQAALDKLAQSERDYNNVLQKKSKADQDAQGKQSKLNKYLDDFAAKLADLMPLFAQINDNIQDIPGLLSTLGVSEDSSLGKGAAALASGANSTMSAMQDYLSGNYVGAAMNGIKAIGSYVQSATNLFAGAGNEKAMEAEIERLSKANESLSTAIDNLAEKISDSDNTNEQSVEAYKQAKKDEEEWEANQRKAINDRASEYTNSGHGFLGMGGKGSFNKHAKSSGWSGWDDFNVVLENIGSTARVRNIQDFWKLSPEDMKELQTSANAAWRALFDNKGYKSPEDLVNEYIERAGKLDELTDSLNEKITGYSWDSFKDGYLSMLEDLESSTSDFADDINEKINNAILSALMNSEFKNRIESLYKEISDAAADDNLTEDEINSIKQKNEKIASDMLKRRSDYEKMGLITTSTSSQTATTNSVSNITNDQATELIGRMTAIQIGVERGNTQRESIVSSIMLASNGISSLQVIQASSRDIADETRTMIANIYLEMRELNGHQENIEKAVLDMQGRVRKIEVNTQDL